MQLLETRLHKKLTQIFAWFFLICIVAAASGNNNVAILKYSLLNHDMSFIDNISQELTNKGFNVKSLTPDQACNASILSPDKFCLYIIPNAKYYPAVAFENLKTYLKNKGNVLLLSAPVFQRFLVECQGKWLDSKILKDILIQKEPEKLMFDFENDDLSGFNRSTNTPQNNTKIGIFDKGINNGKCLKILINNLQGWDLYELPRERTHFQEDCTAITFWAKADDRTDQLAIEIRQWDSSRWFASVDLTTEWKKYVLFKEDFKFWAHDSPERKDNNLNFKNIYYLCMGLSDSHTRISKGRHVLYIDNIATTSSPFKNIEFTKHQKIEQIETLVPSYKGYEIENFDLIKGRNNNFKDLNYSGTFGSAWCPQKRVVSTGLSGQPKFRWIPLTDAFDKGGSKKGTIAWMLINRLGEFDGAAFACIGLNDLSKYKEKPVIDMISRVAESFSDGLFLYRAGAENFSYTPGQIVKLGCEIINRTKNQQDAEVKITVTSNNKVVFQDIQKQVIPAAGQKELFTDYQLPDAGDEQYYVKVELLKNGKTIDCLSHELAVFENTNISKDEFVTVKGSNFYLKGQKWYPVGVNYWPQYIASLERYVYWSNWLKPGNYDPQMIEEDLEIMQQYGINMVSIQIKNYDSGYNLIDFLRRCEKRNIKANLATVEGVNTSPLKFDPAEAEKLIKDFGLANNPTIFAYDIVWEPGNYVFSGRMIKKWDQDWKNWIIERYGSIENAEQDWDYKITDSTGQVIHPSDDQFKEDGQHTIMVAAYRRFMDDLMSKKWNIATQRLKEFIPNQLISYRQGNTLPHDFTITGTAKHVDFFCPEGYAIRGGEDGFNTACFLSRYIDFVTRSKPIIWSEFGVSVWDNRTNRPSQGRIGYQTNYNEMFYKTVLETGCNGIAPWWWPGGLREGENSDYGLLNVDGTPRPSIKILEKYAPLMKKDRERPKADEFVKIDRDEHSGGYWYLAFYQGKDKYAELKKQGKMMGIKTAGTGTNSANTPLLAVGNTKYNGNNPPKFLNAEFNYFKIKDKSGTWVDVKKGDVITVEKNQPVFAKASIGNLQEAKWLSPQNSSSGNGHVYLSSTQGSLLQVKTPISQNVNYLEDAIIDEFVLTKSIIEQKEVSLQMSADKRADFGEVLSFTIIPK